LPVGRQVAAVDAPAAAFGEVAEIAAELDATVAEQAWFQRRVIVGRQVEVIGNAELEAIAAGRADAREQEPRLAGVTRGKGNVRGVQQRNALEVEAYVATGALLSLAVDDALNNQSSLPAGQVVNTTSCRARFPSGDSASSPADPRAGRVGSSNSVSVKLPPRPPLQVPVAPRIRTSGSRYSTSPSTLNERLAAS
jgi:hypothetical protein